MSEQNEETKNSENNELTAEEKESLQKEVNQCDYLSKAQQKHMSTQADMILQFAHMLGEDFRNTHGYLPEIYVNSILALNGHKSRRFISPQKNLLEIEDSFQNRDWVVPFEQE